MLSKRGGAGRLNAGLPQPSICKKNAVSVKHDKAKHNKDKVCLYLFKYQSDKRVEK